MWLMECTKIVKSFDLSLKIQLYPEFLEKPIVAFVTLHYVLVILHFPDIICIDIGDEVPSESEDESDIRHWYQSPSFTPSD